MRMYIFFCVKKLVENLHKSEKKRTFVPKLFYFVILCYFSMRDTLRLRIFLIGKNMEDLKRKDSEEKIYRKGYEDGYKFRGEEMEANRLKACDALTDEQAEREISYVTKFTERNNRIPTFSDCIEEMIFKAKDAFCLTRCGKKVGRVCAEKACRDYRFFCKQLEKL